MTRADSPAETDGALYVSAKNGTGIAELKEALARFTEENHPEKKAEFQHLQKKTAA